MIVCGFVWFCVGLGFDVWLVCVCFCCVLCWFSVFWIRFCVGCMAGIANFEFVDLGFKVGDLGLVFDFVSSCSGLKFDVL